MAISLIVLASAASSLAVLWWAKDPRASTADVLRASMDLTCAKAAELLAGASAGFFLQGLGGDVRLEPGRRHPLLGVDRAGAREADVGGRCC